MHRRAFIRLVGGGVVMAAATSCAPSGPDPRSAWNNPGAGEADIRRKALSWAILAPNPHNMQPWLVDLRRADEITLYVDRSRLLPVTDPFNRQIVIGCGAFLELLLQALSRLGREVAVDLLPDGEAQPLLDARPLFRVRLGGASAANPAPDFGDMLARRTNRNPYTEQAVSSAALQQLIEAGSAAPPNLASADRADAPSEPRVIAGATAEAARVARLKALAWRGAEIEALTPAAHRESVDRTYIGTRDVAAHPWGISLDQPLMTAMNATGILTREKMATPGTTAFRESLKFLKAAADTARAFVWVVTPGNGRADEIAAGRSYVRMSLEAAASGLAIHPWSQGLQEYATQKPVFDALHKELAPGGGRIQMLARIGYPKADIPPAPRRGLAAQILKA